LLVLIGEYRINIKKEVKMKVKTIAIIGTLLIILAGFGVGCGGGSSSSDGGEILPLPPDIPELMPPIPDPGEGDENEENIPDDDNGLDPDGGGQDDGGDGVNPDDDGDDQDDGGGNGVNPEGEDDDQDDDGEGDFEDDGCEDGDGEDEDEDGDGHDDCDDDFEDFSDLDDDGIPDNEDPDADGDGFYADEDDCNDLDDEVYPGAPDKPDYPNYVDSNCDGVDGDEEFAYWVAPDGKDTNLGTIDMPFATIAKAIDMAKLDLSDIRDVYVVEGDYVEDVTLDEGVGLYGGYGQLDADLNRARDIDLQVAMYTSASLSFEIKPSSKGKESVVEGMTFVASANNPALVVINSSPIVRHNKIYGVTSLNFSIGAQVIALGEAVETKPFFYANQIKSSRCTGEKSCLSIAFIAGSAGVNALVEPRLEGNDIFSAEASQLSIGVLLFREEEAYAFLEALKNDIKAAYAYNSIGIMMGYNPFKLEMTGFTSAEIHKNKIHGGQVSDVTFGVISLGSEGLVRLTNNFITGGHQASSWSIGIHAHESTLSIFNNTINNGRTRGHAVSIHLLENVSAKIDNNIFYSHKADESYGVYESYATSTPDSLRNNLFDGIDIKYHDFIAGDLLGILAVNALQDIAVIGDNITGDSAFVNAHQLDYHLLAISDAIDAGLDLSEVTQDFDSDNRPEGASSDIGADEFVWPDN